jgi:hypothetical protein
MATVAFFTLRWKMAENFPAKCCQLFICNSRCLIF